MSSVQTRRQIVIAALVGGLLLVGLGIFLIVNNGSGESATTTTAYSGPTTIPFSMQYNARADVETGACTQVGQSWKFAGKLTNSANVTRRYQIVVDYVSVPGNTVLDTKIRYVENVAPRQTEHWNVVGATGLSNVGCVVRHVQAWKQN